MASSSQSHKLGLDDESVIHCYDRGERDYHKKRSPPIEPQAVPCHRQCGHENTVMAQMRCDLENMKKMPSHSSCDHEKSLRALIKCELEESRKRYPPNNHSSYFIPRRKLESIVTPYRVRQIIETLACYENLSDAGKDKLRDEMCLGEKQCWKLLLVLLIANKQERILHLIQDGASDDCLPIGVESSSCCVCHNHPTTHPEIASWKDAVREEASRWSYAVKAPFFTREKGSHNHYILDSMDVLPILRITDVTSDAPQIQLKTGNNNVASGGFGDVEKVILDESHNNFDNLDTADQIGRARPFALKTLHSSTDRDMFSRELASLRSFQDGDDEHLIKLLATFEVREKRGGNLEDKTTYYLLFPWAEGDLWKYWKKHCSEVERLPKCVWMAEQIWYLAQALMNVHNERPQQLKQMENAITETELELYGRHGDIKAANVLWFDDSGTLFGRLVLADFGLGRLHSKYSRSEVDPKLLDKSATYKAPEFDLSEGKISRISDIFSFGCLCLEFVTWYLEGWEAVNDWFPDFRLEPDIYNIKSDTFFTIEHHKTPEEKAVVKKKVTDWISRLKKNSHCSAYILQFLELVEEKMLHPDPKKRIKSPMLVAELKLLAEKSKEG